jgi:hypothetical protein
MGVPALVCSASASWLLPKSDARQVRESLDKGSTIGSTIEFPTFENADTFVDRLVRDGLLVRDPVVEAVLQGQPQDLSVRAVQYRFLQATGLTHRTVQQIERAKYAISLLRQGASIPDTVYQAGYFDQPHLTRALKRFVGQTPAQIARMSSTVSIL